MNDDRSSHHGESNLAPLIGFALGALVGGTLALLLAPASGAQTRRRMGDAARRMSQDARHTLDEARANVSEAASGLGADVKSAIEAGREAFRHDGEPNEPRAASRVGQNRNPPSAGTS